VPIMVQLTQVLPLGGKLRAKRDAAQADSEVVAAEALTRAQDVERDVTRAFSDLFVAERTLTVHDGMLGTLRTLAAVAAARVSAGKTEVVDQLKAQGELLKEEGVHEALTAERTSAIARLAALLDRSPAELTGPTEDPDPSPSLAPDDQLLARAMKDRPELRAAASATHAAEARTQLASAAGVPDLTPILGYMHTFNAPPQNNFLFLGLEANLPIFRGSKIEPAVAAARARVEAAGALAQALRNRIEAEVRSRAAELRGEQAQVEIYGRLIPLSRRTLESAMSAYAAGRVGMLTVLDSERDVLMRQVELAQHRAVLEQRRADLERALGGHLSGHEEGR
jgi:cobalt-zinc-cadmium efflux system outer membrane protein